MASSTIVGAASLANPGLSSHVETPQTGTADPKQVVHQTTKNIPEEQSRIKKMGRIAGNQMRRYLHGVSLQGRVLRDGLYRPARGSRNPNKLESLEEDLKSLRKYAEEQKSLGENAPPFPADHPFLTLKYVSRCKELKDNLRSLRAHPDCEQMIREFKAAIRSDNWDDQEMLSHRYMGKKFPHDEVPPLIENLALLAYQDGGKDDLMRGELEAFFEWLNAKEQFGGEKASLYRTKHPVDENNMKLIGKDRFLKKKAEELVAAIKSGDWGHGIFNEVSFSSKNGQDVLLQDLIIFAKRNGQLKPEEFHLAFAWVDAKLDHLKSNMVSGYQDPAPLLFPEPDLGRLNELQHDLSTRQVREIGEALRSGISSGNLKSEVFSRTYLVNHYPELATKVSMKDIVQEEKRAGRLSNDAYQAMMLWLSLREQYGQKLFKFANASAGATEGVWVHLPQTVASVKMYRLFHESGGLTFTGREYLKNIADALSEPDEFGGYEHDAKAFEQRLKELPRSLQMFFEIDDLDATDVHRKIDLKGQLANIRQSFNTPLCNGYRYRIRPMDEQDWTELEPILVSSAGVMREFNRLAWMSKMKPGSLLPSDDKTLSAQRVFGRQSEETRDKETMNGVHILLSYHPDVSDHFVLPHGTKVGVFIAPRHDSDFHMPVGNMHEPSVRTALCQVLPKFILKEVPAKNENEKATARELAGLMGDLDYVINMGETARVEESVAAICFEKLMELNENTPLDRGHYESAKHVDYSRFYLRLLKSLEAKGDGFPAPYGKASKSGSNVDLNYTPVISGDWSRLKKAIVMTIMTRIENMLENGIKLTPEGKKLVVELYDYGRSFMEAELFPKNIGKTFAEYALSRKEKEEKAKTGILRNLLPFSSSRRK